MAEVLLAGGGTAGHVNPLLAVAAELRRRDPGTEITVLGTREGLEADLVPAAGHRMVVVPRAPLPRRPTPDWFRLPGRVRAAVRTAAAVIAERQVDVVVGFGGYVAVPAYLAARRAGVPIVIHEQNARAGLANRLGARWAAAVAVTFPGTALRGGQVTGLPLRPQIAELVEARRRDHASARRAGAAALDLDPDRTTLLVTGGSLGAARVNATMAQCAADLLDSGAQVLHLTGAGKDDAVRTVVAGRDGYHVRAYLDRMEHALAVADLVVARAGAGTVSELAALGLPAVYVPLPIGNGEQRRNAAPVVSAGGAVLVDDAAFTPDWVRANVPPLLADAGRRAAMAAAAAGTGVPDAAARVVDLVEAVR